ncbi:MAG: YceI family protein [Nevskiales bacterium]|nr:YceI family protein [Nevskiales bacterium]
MKPSRMAAVALAFGVAVASLVACSKSDAPSGAPSASAAAEIKAPAGTYMLDPNHSSLSFSLSHLGLSNYVARFTRYTVMLTLEPADLATSSVTATMESASVRTDFSGDYKGAHKDSPYPSWDEDLAQSPKFFNAGQYPQIAFQSTRVEPTGPGTMRITGDLTLLGQTRPVTLEARVVGSVAVHPFTQRGALGFSATGVLKRSEFGMMHLLNPLLVGDEVTVHFEGEFNQVVTPAS